VNALLPGSSWSSISKQVKETVPEMTPEKEESASVTSVTEIESASTADESKIVEKPSTLLTNITKVRSRILKRHKLLENYDHVSFP